MNNIIVGDGCHTIQMAEFCQISVLEIVFWLIRNSILANCDHFKENNNKMKILVYGCNGLNPKNDRNQIRIGILIFKYQI